MIPRWKCVFVTAYFNVKLVWPCRPSLSNDNRPACQRVLAIFRHGMYGVRNSKTAQASVCQSQILSMFFQPYKNVVQHAVPLRLMEQIMVKPFVET